MKKLSNVLLALMVLGSAFFSGAAPAASARGLNVLEFSTMVGVPTALTGAKSAPVLRGINGGGLPWMIGSGKGELSASGHLEVTVQGLVLAAGANAGSNPINSFRAVVSCVTRDGGVANVQTDPFPATTGPASSGGGDAHIEAAVSLPPSCIAPIIFVTSPGGAWFAATGF
jgi:hypothetical protein